VRRVDSLTALGVVLKRDGCTTASVDHRLVAASKAFYANFGRLGNKIISSALRVRAFFRDIVPVLLYGCEGWTVTQSLLKRLQAWEYRCLRRMLHPRRQPGEGRMGYNMRTAASIRGLLKRFCCRGVCYRFLKRVHGWPARILESPSQDGRQPLWDILRWKSEVEWRTQQPYLRTADPLNTLQWRHVKPGPCRQWEAALVEVHGDSWHQVFLNCDGARRWRESSHDFVCKTLAKYGMASPAETPTGGAIAKNSCSMKTPASHLKDMQPYERKTFCLHFDSLLVAGWLSGSFACREEEARDLTDTTLQNLWESCRGMDWSFCAKSWARWIPRSQNVFADWLANQSVGQRKSFCWTTASLDDMQSFCLAGYADGACKGTTGEGSSSFALLAFDPKTGQCHLVMAGARYWAACTAVQAELAAASYLAHLLRSLIHEQRVTLTFDTEEVALDWSHGLRQLEDTISNKVRVAGTFV